MSLSYYNDSMLPLGTDPLRSFHDGHAGGAHEQLFYIRNHDPSRYYTNITVKPEITGAYDGSGEFGGTGWSVKVMYGKRRPTEAEWDRMRSGDGVELPDIGTTEAADTFTNHPIWVRVYCPGGEMAQLKENMRLKISYFERKVGA